MRDAAEDHATQAVVDTTSAAVAGAALEGGASIALGLEMPSEILSLSSPSHMDDLKVKMTETVATVQVSDLQSLDAGFLLDIDLANINAPRMWVEQHPSGGSSACMLAFYPEVDAPPLSVAYHVVLDLSASMAKCLKDAVSLAVLGET